MQEARPVNGFWFFHVLVLALFRLPLSTKARREFKALLLRANDSVAQPSTSKSPTTSTADLSERDNKENPVVKEEETNDTEVFEKSKANHDYRRNPAIGIAAAWVITPPPASSTANHLLENVTPPSACKNGP